MNDLDLLRRFEPVIRYTGGEMFFPCSVTGYLAQCSLWRRPPQGEPVLLLPVGSVTPERLAANNLQGRADELFLQFVDRPLDPLAYQRWLRRDGHARFDSAGRLARVGFPGRLAEALFGFSLLVRGRVPGGTAARAEEQYRELLDADPRYVYYGRVLRDSGYTICHYLFFYAMNDWRSTFHGVNDHEADWEQIFVYLTEEEGGYTPRWVAFAAHDFAGDDLRRRWDDPELTKVGEHAVVYAGAGSHAAYVLPGEYLMEVEPRFIKPLKQVLRPLRKFAGENLTGGDGVTPANLDAPLVALAFVDYARGDGLSIGPGQDGAWSPEILSDDLPWVSGYRGLWGLDTRDPLGGERAPAGPKFDRDGSVRHAWHDPLGWAGLDKVPAPSRLEAETTAAIAALKKEADERWAAIEGKRETLRIRGLTVQALSSTPNLTGAVERHRAALDAAEKELEQLSKEHAAVLEQQRIMESYLEWVRSGDPGDPQAHLRHRAVPQPPLPRIARALDFWAAISGALLAGLLIVLVAVQPPHWPLWAMLSMLMVGAVESALRDKLSGYLLVATVVLAAISAVLLIFDYWRWVLPGAVLFIFLYSLLSNVRELRSRRAQDEGQLPAASPAPPPTGPPPIH